MKIKTTIIALIVFCQFCFSQSRTEKLLHCLIVNDSIKIDGGSILNLNSKTKTYISELGFFDIIAKPKDSLLISSIGFKPKKIILTENEFKTPLLTIKLETYIYQLNEVQIKKENLKPNLGNIQSIIDRQYFDDKQSTVKSRLMPTLEIVDGLDFIKIGKKIGKLFEKEKPEKPNMVDYGDFHIIVPYRINSYFFTHILKLKEEEIGLFLIYCENDKKSNTLLNPDLEFQLIDFLITKNEEFKKFTIFEK
jgi:hypothetical protein